MLFFLAFWRHANNHFGDEQEDQELATDLELAQQLALAPSSPSPPSQVTLAKTL